MDVRIPYTNLSEILEDEYVFVARCKARNEKRIEVYKRMIRELETENRYYATKMSIIQQKKEELR